MVTSLTLLRLEWKKGVSEVEAAFSVGISSLYMFVTDSTLHLAYFHILAPDEAQLRSANQQIYK